MRLTIVIRGDVEDEVAAKTILTTVDTAVKPITENGFTISTSLQLDIEVPSSPP